MQRTSTTQYLLRFDDLCPTMNWKVWAEIEAVLVQRRLKPLLAVVPDNRDPGLRVGPPVRDFWDRVRAWQDRGWTIALHGFQHRYITRHAGMVAIRKKSEFAGLRADVQREKLLRGVEIFQREGITPRVWVAPGDSFDAATVALLQELGIHIICHGCFRFPFLCPREMIWVPQQLYHFRPAPPGVWTVCYHHNQWNASRAAQFREEIDRYEANIVSIEDVVDGKVPRKRGWSAWLCTHPRLSDLLIRTELKLWIWWSAGRRFQCPAATSLELLR